MSATTGTTLLQHHQTPAPVTLSLGRGRPGETATLIRPFELEEFGRFESQRRRSV